MVLSVKVHQHTHEDLDLLGGNGLMELIEPDVLGSVSVGEIV